MSTQATVQVLDTSYDMSGVSVVTATKLAATPRQGIIYNPQTLAAATPVWFHPMADGTFMAVLADRWTNATIGSGGPQSYSDYDVVLTPARLTFDPATGSAGTVTDLPTNLSGDRMLSGAFSRFDYLMTVGTIGISAYLQHHRIGGSGEVLLHGEEVIPEVNGVSFHAGVWVAARHVVLVGVDEAGQLFLARKPWGRVGVSNDPNAQWEYHSERGWFTDSSVLEPLLEHGGSPLVSSGPVSYGQLKDRDFLSVVNGSYAKIYSLRPSQKSWGWTQEFQTPLDSGGVFFLQPQLYYNPTVMPDGKRVGIPYVTIHHVNTSGAEQLLVDWGLFARL